MLNILLHLTTTNYWAVFVMQREFSWRRPKRTEDRKFFYRLLLMGFYGNRRKILSAHRSHWSEYDICPEYWYWRAKVTSEIPSKCHDTWANATNQRAMSNYPTGEISRFTKNKWIQREMHNFQVFWQIACCNIDSCNCYRCVTSVFSSNHAWVWNNGRLVSFTRIETASIHCALWKLIGYSTNEGNSIQNSNKRFTVMPINISDM